MKIVTAFRCEFCPRPHLYMREISAKAHESDCIYNPVSRACATCKHWKGNECAKDAFDPTRINQRNPQGLRVECPKWAERGDFE